MRSPAVDRIEQEIREILEKGDNDFKKELEHYAKMEAEYQKLRALMKESK